MVSGLSTRIVSIEVITHKETGLMMASSPDLKGLFVHARTEKELDDRLPVAIKDLLEFTGSKVIAVQKIDEAPKAPEGFRSANFKFNAELEAA